MSCGERCPACAATTADDIEAVEAVAAIVAMAHATALVGAPQFHAASPPLRKAVADIIEDDLTSMAEGRPSLLAGRLYRAHGMEPVAKPKPNYRVTISRQELPEGKAGLTVTMHFKEAAASESRLP